MKPNLISFKLKCDKCKETIKWNYGKLSGLKAYLKIRELMDKHQCKTE